MLVGRDSDPASLSTKPGTAEGRRGVALHSAGLRKGNIQEIPSHFERTALVGVKTCTASLCCVCLYVSAWEVIRRREMSLLPPLIAVLKGMEEKFGGKHRTDVMAGREGWTPADCVI